MSWKIPQPKFYLVKPMTIASIIAHTSHSFCDHVIHARAAVLSVKLYVARWITLRDIALQCRLLLSNVAQLHASIFLLEVYHQVWQPFYSKGGQNWARTKKFSKLNLVFDLKFQGDIQMCIVFRTWYLHIHNGYVFIDVLSRKNVKLTGQRLLMNHLSLHLEVHSLLSTNLCFLLLTTP